MANLNIKIMFNNINLMLESLDEGDLQPEESRLFAKLNKFDRNFRSLFPSINKKRHITRGIRGFKLKRDGKTYYFKNFTNKNISKIDLKRIKKHTFRPNQLIWKVLEIVGSHELLEPLFIFGTTNDEYKYLVEYSKNGKRYIIDIEYDIIMESNAYRELKNLKEVRTLDINQVYMMDVVLKLMEGKIPVIFFIMFYDEVMPYFMNLLGYKFEGYDDNGINYRNANMFYHNCDTIFKMKSNSEKLPEFYDINDITMHPENYNSFSNFAGGFLFKNYPIYLYSNMVADENVRKRLFSSERFGNCHYDNPIVAFSLKGFFKEKNVDKDVYVVSGKCYYKTKRYVYHTWIELESATKGKYYVFDFTQNLMMERSKFYEYAGVEVLESIEIDDYIYMENLFKGYNIRPMYRLKDIFATDFIRDLEKNKSILRNKMN